MKKALKIIAVVILSLILSALLCQYKGDRWEEKVRTVLYKVKNDSIPDYAKETVDEKGIPFVYYREQNGITAGNQYNPTIISNYALDYYQLIKKTKDSTAKRKFLNCVEWLANNMTHKDNYALYEFRWRQPWYPSVGAPYTSGMTSGRAIEVFTRAYTLFDSPKYLQNAKALVNGFYVSIDSGGFTYKEKGGWWYEEIADPGKQTPRILDGHIFAVLGVREYWLETREDSAAYIFGKGLQSLKRDLPKYDAGNGMIYYDAAKKIADKKYRRLITSQLQHLHTTTPDPLFLQYYKKWSAPLKRPYLVRMIQERNISGLILYFLITILFSTILIFLYFFVIPKATVRKL